MPKIFQAIDTLELKDQGAGARPSATGMHASVGKEYVDFSKELALEKKVENYLQDVIDMMRRSLKDIAAESRIRFGQKEKAKWLADDPAQVTLLINMVNWVVNVENGFDNNSMAQALEDQKGMLNDLIIMVQGDLTPSMRQKIASMITMDAHSRDIIDKLINEGVVTKDEF